ncbi:MAG TPA: hypothetical protein VMZ06_03030 [Candidatus Bathyarchaeia archaeon]|nr:hypothetical protein [Candidatus Bathyarchaeia archaeon]
MTFANDRLRPADYLSITIIMGLMGAFFWAIRGTGGFGGEQGGILAGLGWAVLWYGFSRIDGTARTRPYGHAGAIVAITFGIAVGGFTGYGVYNSWVRGQFFLDHPNGLRDVGAWTGYAMLFVCGLHWGGIPGAFLAWCAPRKPVRWQGWAGRIGGGIAGAVAAGVIVRVFPQWFLPFYNEGIYQLPENATCIRAAGSIRNIAPHVGLFLGFLAFEIGRRDWRAVGIMLVMALGFAIPFSVGGYWHTMNDSALQISWWKNWEMSIGLGGGLAFGLAFYLFNRPEDVAPRPVTSTERIAGAGIPLAIGLAQILMGGYEGFRSLHKLPWAELPDLSAFLVIAGMVLVAIISLPLIGRSSTAAPRHAAEPIPSWVPFAVVTLIVVVGYLVSIPPKLQLANNVLLLLYTAYIAVSAMLIFPLLKCKTKS